MKLMNNYLKVDDCLLKTTGSANEILNILLEQWIMFGVLIKKLIIVLFIIFELEK